MQEKILDIDKVLKCKAPKLDKWLPSFAKSYLKRIVHQDELNEIFVKAGDLRDSDFTSFFLNELQITYSVEAMSPSLSQSSLAHTTFVSNHPLGGADGVILLDLLNRKFGHTVALVNDLLLNIPAMRGLFIPVSKLSSQSRENALLLDGKMSGDENMLFFPAGKVSRRQKNGIVKDDAWRKTFLSKSKDHGRDIVPIYFDAQCSHFFLSLAYYREKLGLPNIEFLYLADELFKCRGKHFTIYIGDKIPFDSLAEKPEKEMIADIYDLVYNLKPNNK